ncbi:hypothetical protein [Winogradskyella sp.]|uniref:hypothetical protein n=1 Tax=Winogradskyella sp. TaxID=1883156 RepID=UPI003BAC1A77
MKLKSFIVAFFSLTIVVTLISCGDDDGPSIVVQERDRTEQQAADSDSLIDYLSTHYYNSSFFETGTNHEYSDIIITELEAGEDVPAGHTLLLDAVGDPRTTTFFDVEYEYYVLNLNQGGGEAPRFTDQVSVRYEGISVTTGDVFDSLASSRILNLQGNIFTTIGAIRGWQLVIPTFNTATDFSIDNGFVNYNNYGLGVMFLPSGLGFYSGTNTGTSYDNLVFKFELLRFEQEDHDGDGIPSYIEDIDNNLEVEDDDSDEDQLANFIDADDDNDGVNTRDELVATTYIVDTTMGDEEPVLGANEYEVSRTEVDGIITINTVRADDTNNNGILDYLDESVSENYNEEESEG